MRAVSISAVLEGVIATTDVKLTYKNEYQNPIECMYEFPLEKETLMSSLVIKLSGQVITARVDKKANAKVHYQEAIKAKQTAVIAERQSE